MVDQLEDYVIPRVMTLDAPLLAVVGGSTGAGKSTLVNSLVGTRVTEPGVLRPTTRSPVLVHNPADATWFGQDRLLPDLERVTRSTNDPSALQLVPNTSVPEGLAILDAPDVDSVEESNRTLAAQLLAAADLWIFVTSAARYADQVPWDFLRQAADRSAAVAIVLDRTPPEAVDTVAAHLARMLASRGLKDSPLFVVVESSVDEDGLLPVESVAEISGWLVDLAADAEARGAVVRQTLEGAIRTLTRRTHDVADAVAEQVAAEARLRVDANARLRPCGRRHRRRDGRRHAAARRGAGAVAGVRRHGRAAARPRDQGRLAARPRRQRDQGQAAAGRAGDGRRRVRAGDADPRARRGGRRARRGLLAVAGAGSGAAREAGEDLGRASRDLRRKTERAVRDWQQDVLDMVRTEGADKRTTARFLAYGVNGLSVALMVVVFSHTAGLTGAEAGIAGGSAVLGQKLLEAVFGDQAVRSLAERARKSLAVRVREIVDAERARYVDLLDSLGLDGQTPEQLRAAARRVDDVRYQSLHGGDPLSD